MIEQVVGRLVEIVTEWGEKDGRPCKAASDPFSFDLQPRSDFDSWYLDPPVTSSEGWIGSVEHVTATCSIWLSREAGQDAGGAALVLAGDLAKLRHLVVRADLDPDQELQTDVHVHQGIRTEVEPRGEGEVVVVGRLAVSLDYEVDAENP